MLEADLLRAQHAAERIEGWDALSEVRQAVVIEMIYNLGPAGVLRFSRMLAALVAGDYVGAADEMRASRWARQVGTRAETLAARMAHG